MVLLLVDLMMAETSTFQMTHKYQDAGWWRLGQSFGNTSQILQSQGLGVDMYMRGLLRDPPNVVMFIVVVVIHIVVVIIIILSSTSSSSSLPAFSSSLSTSSSSSSLSALSPLLFCLRPPLPCLLSLRRHRHYSCHYLYRRRPPPPLLCLPSHRRCHCHHHHLCHRCSHHTPTSSPHYHRCHNLHQQCDNHSSATAH